MKTLYRIAALGSAMILAACGAAVDGPQGQRHPSVTASFITGNELGSSTDQASAAPTVTIHGYRNDYTIINANGVVSLQNNIDKSTRTYVGVQTIKFVDRQTSFDLTSVDAQVYRLYQAAFNRTPDLEGLGFWVQAARNGASLDAISQSFIASKEFKNLYGENVSVEKFVLAAYTNVLNRQPDADGYDWWVNTVKNGVVRSVALLGFSESAENKALTYEGVKNGFDLIVPRQPGDPILVSKSSYENAKNAGISPQSLPVVDPSFNEGIQNGYAFADFFQDGSMSLVAFTEHDPLDGSWPPQVLGSVYFYKKADDGTWVDRTASLLGDATGCILPRKLLVADFNNDGRPDVFATCSGVDVAPYSGENFRILLSQSDGRYKNVKLPFSGYAHGASAADVDGDGTVDIVIADMKGLNGKTPIYFLMNDGNGQFKADYDRANRPEWEYKVAFWTVELIPDSASGKYKLFVGGTESYIDANKQTQGGAPTLLISPDSNGNYASTPTKSMPALTGFQNIIDVVVTDHALYTLRVQSEPFYGGIAIQKVDLSTGESTVVYSHVGWYPGKYLAFPTTWFSWMVPYEGRLHSLNAYFAVAAPI